MKQSLKGMRGSADVERGNRDTTNEETVMEKWLMREEVGSGAAGCYFGDPCSDRKYMVWTECWPVLEQIKNSRLQFPG